MLYSKKHLLLYKYLNFEDPFIFKAKAYVRNMELFKREFFDKTLFYRQSGKTFDLLTKGIVVAADTNNTVNLHSDSSYQYNYIGRYLKNFGDVDLQGGFNFFGTKIFDYKLTPFKDVAYILNTTEPLTIKFTVPAFIKFFEEELHSEREFCSPEIVIESSRYMPDKYVEGILININAFSDPQIL